MKAIVLESNGNLKYKDVPVPEVKKDECLVKIKSAGVCNSDIFRAFENGAYHYPLIMGHEFSGTIVECGAGVQGLHSGQAVVAFPLIPCFKCDACMRKKWVLCSGYDYYGSRRDGAFAEFVAVKSWNLMPVSNKCNLDIAAVTETLAVAIHTLNYITRTRAGRLLILGAGFIGMSLAKLAGETGKFGEIWVFDRNRFKLEIVKQFGFNTALIDANNSNNYDSFASFFDVVIEACGSSNTYRDSINYCKNQALLLWMGNIQGDLTFSKNEISSILRKELIIQGVWNSDYQPEGPSDWKDAIDVITKEKWINELVSHNVPLYKGKELLEDMYNVRKHSLPHTYLKAFIKIG